MSNNLLTVPVVWYADSTTIRTNMVLLNWNLWRIILEVITPCKANVHIDRITIAIHLPDARNREVLPLGIIVISTKEIRWALISILNPVELPVSIEGKVISRLLHIKLCSTHIFSRCEGKEVSMRCKTVDGIHLKVMPFCESRLHIGRLCMNSRHRHSHQQSRQKYLFHIGDNLGFYLQIPFS